MAEEQGFVIPRVKLGNQGLEVSKVGFGRMGLSVMYNAPVPDEVGISIIKEAFKRGITFFDTADVYRHCTNEILAGKALKQLPRENIQLATKFGISAKNFNFRNVSINSSPQYVRECSEASLKRLDVEYIDLYYQHCVDTSVPMEETMGELKKLVEEGKIKYIGLSEASLDTIKRAHAIHPITAVQMEWSLWTRDIEEDPAWSGFFGGKAVLESLSSETILKSHPRFAGENLEKNKVLYTRIKNLADKIGCSPAHLALAWVLNQGDVVPIPGELTSRVLCV
ncbi:aldo/keto reductase, putative [Ricinus communis]|uniref:Aldo/keto reductase, putative n=1 Tax=Ricinus communis TaxID=3988 RepID=B9REP9_RICCO|nr:aldo/keto reductase, putative [Ricinus communis]